MPYPYLRPFVSFLALTLLLGGCFSTKQAKPTAQNEPVGIVNEPVQPDVTPVAVPMAPKPKSAKPKPLAKTASKSPDQASKTSDEPVRPAPVAQKTHAPVPPFEHYTVELKPSGKEFKAGDVLSMRLYINAPGYPVTGNESHGVKVTFNGLGFAEERPPVECLRLSPNGSEVIYNVKTEKEGIYRVTADIDVSPTHDCKIVSTHKTSKPIVVVVN